MADVNLNQGLIDGMRACADWLEANPQPRLWSEVQLNAFPANLAEAIKGVGHLEKRADGNYFYLKKPFSDNVSIHWNAKRETVCERVVIGSKKVEVPVMAQIGVETKEVEEVEWRCPESILAALKPPPLVRCDVCRGEFPPDQIGQSAADTVLCQGCAAKAQGVGTGNAAAALYGQTYSGPMH